MGFDQNINVVLYARVSTKDQDLETQLSILNRAAEYQNWNVVGSFSEKISGTKDKRPELYKAIQLLRDHEADAIIVTRLSRFGRDANETVSLMYELKQRGQHIIALSEGLDTRTRFGKMMFHILVGMNEWEVEEIRERTKEKMEDLKKKGKKLGRKSKLSSSKWKNSRFLNLVNDPKFSIKMIAEELNVSKRTIQRELKDREIENVFHNQSGGRPRKDSDQKGVS